MRHLSLFFESFTSLSHILRAGVARPVSCHEASVILNEAKNLSAASVIPDLIGNLAPVISSERSESRNLLLLGNQSIKSINL